MRQGTNLAVIISSVWVLPIMISAASSLGDLIFSYFYFGHLLIVSLNDLKDKLSFLGGHLSICGPLRLWPFSQLSLWSSTKKYSLSVKIVIGHVIFHLGTLLFT